MYIELFLCSRRYEMLYVVSRFNFHGNLKWIVSGFYVKNFSDGKLSTLYLAYFVE